MPDWSANTGGIVKVGRCIERRQCAGEKKRERLGLDLAGIVLQCGRKKPVYVCVCVCGEETEAALLLAVVGMQEKKMRAMETQTQT